MTLPMNLTLREEKVSGITLTFCKVTDPALTVSEKDRVESFSFDTAPVAGCFVKEIPSGAPYTCVYQHKVWWLRPFFTEKVSEIPERTQLLLTKDKDDFRVFMAVTGEKLRLDLKGCEEGLACEVQANGCPADEKEHLVMAEGMGEDPYEVIRQMAEVICEKTGRSELLVKNKKLPPVFEGFGWCTWNAFYKEVNEKDILTKLREFKEKKVPLRYLLIDDGWSDADYKSLELQSYGADPLKFPQGLKHTVEEAHKIYPDLKIGVWHALLGYWLGFKKDSPVCEEWKDQLIERNGHYVLKPEREVIEAFYKKWHSYLKEQGITFCKIDGQGYASMYYKGIADYEASSGNYLKAAQASCKENFEGSLINCMGMAPENMWLRGEGVLARSSDDFFPDEPHWFREHALQNSFNTLLQGQFYIGDWDMFWTVHEDDRANAILRAISGGPIYVSDKLEKTNPEVLLPLMDEEGTVLRLEEGGRPTMDCLLEDPVKKGLLKIFNKKTSETGETTYYAAVFNLLKEEKEASGTLATCQIPGLKGKEWIVYHHSLKKAEILTDDHPLTLTLPEGGADMLVIREKKDITWIGDTSKYISSYVIPGETDEKLLQGKTITLVKAEGEEVRTETVTY